MIFQNKPHLPCRTRLAPRALSTALLSSGLFLLSPALAAPSPEAPAAPTVPAPSAPDAVAPATAAPAESTPAVPPAAPPAAPTAATPSPTFQRFLQWFGGRFDNHLQTLEDEEAEAEHPHERIHSIFHPVTLPAIAPHLFYVEQYSGNDPSRVYRQRLYQFEERADGEIVLLIFAFQEQEKFRGAHLDPSRLNELTREGLIPKPGCEVYWRWSEDHFEGTTRRGACRIPSRRGGELTIEDDLYLDEDEIWIRDRATNDAGELVFGNPEGIPHKLRRAELFRGWAALRDPENRERWIRSAPLLLHDQGAEIPLVDEAGEPLPYVVSLAQMVYGKTGTAVLKLTVSRRGEDRFIGYSWSEPDSHRIGINLDIVQTGLTRITEPNAP